MLSRSSWAWVRWLLMSNFIVGPALSAIAKRSSGFAKGLVFGDADERLLNKLGHEALVVALNSLCDDPKQIDALVQIVDEHFAPGELQMEARTVADMSPAGAMAAALAQQLAPLFDPIHDGLSTAETFGLNATVTELVGAILRAVGFLAAFEPRDAYFVHALREELIATAALAPRLPGLPRVPEVTVRYLVCKAFDLIAEMCDHDFAAAPVANPLWLDNEVSAFWRRLIARNGDRYRETEVSGECFDTTSSYLRLHPDALPPSDDQALPYYRLVRAAAPADLPAISTGDPLTAQLVADGVDVALAALAVVHREECGDPPLPVLETFLTRPVWAVVAEIRVDAPAASLGHLEVDRCVAGPIVDVTEAPLDSVSVPLPGAPVSSDQSILVPMATIVPRLPIAASRAHEVRFDWLGDEGRTQSGAYGHLGQQRFDYWGPALVPRRLHLSSEGRTATADLRPFDPARAFVVDRGWAIGSCPHLFEVDSNGSLLYIGSAFGAAPLVLQHYSVEPSVAARSVLVAELEDEETTLTSVRLDGEVVAQNVTLARGDTFRIDLPAWPVQLELLGWYDPRHSGRQPGSAVRNAYVRDFIAAAPSHR